MTGRVVQFRLTDGHALDVAVSDLEKIYGELWRLAPGPGAVWSKEIGWFHWPCVPGPRPRPK